MWLLLKRPARFNAVFFVLFPRRSRKWTPLLAECAEMCQYYFSIFEIADYMDGADNTVLQRRLKRARQPVCPPKKQGTRELPREFPFHFFLFTVLTHTNYAHGVGRGWGVGRGLGVTLGVGETVGDGVGVGVGLGGIDGVGVTGGAVGVGDGEAHGGIS